MVSASFETAPVDRFGIVVRKTGELWPPLPCTELTCRCQRVVCHDPADARQWRHLDAFGRPTQIACVLPRARCTACRKAWTVPAPWEGNGQHFTRDFKAFALTLLRKMPVKRAGDILGEDDTRLWRNLGTHAKAAHAATDFPGVVHVGAHERNRCNGHQCITVLADLIGRAWFSGRRARITGLPMISQRIWTSTTHSPMPSRGPRWTGVRRTGRAPATP